MRYITFPAVATMLILAAGCATSSSSRSPDHRAAAAEPATRITLAEAEARLSADAEQPTRFERLYQRGPVTIMLRQFERGATVPDHSVPGTAMALVTEGHLEITVGDQAHSLQAGQMLVMEPDVVHNVRAIEASQMLLTIANP